MLDDLRKYQLECLRLAADCRNIAIETWSPALRSHYLAMAEFWSVHADQQLDPKLLN